MDVTVAIPDDLYKQVESLVCRQAQSRSDLYAQALRMLIRAIGELEMPIDAPSRPEWLDWPSDRITRSLNEYADKCDTSLDPALAAAQTKALLEDNEWE